MVLKVLIGRVGTFREDDVVETESEEEREKDGNDKAWSGAIATCVLSMGLDKKG